MMKVFSKCSVVLFGLMLFFGNSDSCYGMNDNGEDKIEEKQGDVKKDKKKGLEIEPVFQCGEEDEKRKNIINYYEIQMWNKFVEYKKNINYAQFNDIDEKYKKKVVCQKKIKSCKECVSNIECDIKELSFIDILDTINNDIVKFEKIKDDEFKKEEKPKLQIAGEDLEVKDGKDKENYLYFLKSTKEGLIKKFSAEDEIYNDFL